ncbi:hypothetical protein JEQ12_004021 [Ovis aries]|uniref:Uncharacterized protein n=1 Tax=Ovis aries TaxID=9940 RepID=A0A835ZX88_SHEEP|nr:hypothetical protein JEQ12_004021 [Ovis aries]
MEKQPAAGEAPRQGIECMKLFTLAAHPEVDVWPLPGLLLLLVLEAGGSEDNPGCGLEPLSLLGLHFLTYAFLKARILLAADHTSPLSSGPAPGDEYFHEVAASKGHARAAVLWRLLLPSAGSGAQTQQL